MKVKKMKNILYVFTVFCLTISFLTLTYLGVVRYLLSYNGQKTNVSKSNTMVDQNTSKIEASDNVDRNIP